MMKGRVRLYMCTLHRAKMSHTAQSVAGTGEQSKDTTAAWPS